MSRLVVIKDNVDIYVKKMPENDFNSFCRATLRAVERWLDTQGQEENMHESTLD